MRSLCFALIHVLLSVWLTSSSASAHPLAPNLLEVRELENGRVAVRWKEPANTPRGAEMAPEFSRSCTVSSPPAVEREAGGFLYHWQMDCGASGLVGERIGVTGLEGRRASVLVRAELSDGRVVQELLTGERVEIVVPERVSTVRLATRYLSLGFWHLLSGWDHMLLLLGILLLIPDLRVLVATVTSFTLGHAITLTFAALGWVRLGGAWVEVAIAASILVLAAEILRRPNPRSGAAVGRLRPCAMALLFGLLHGLGFAGALAEIGLPRTEIPLALFAFNLGIEAGQLFAIAIMGALLFAAARFFVTDFRRPSSRARSAMAHGIGTLAAYWCIERIWLLA